MGAIGDVYACALRSTLNGEQCVNTFHLRTKTTADPTTATLTTILTGIKDILRTMQVDDLAYSDWTALQVRGAGTTYQTTAPFRVATISYAGGFTGTLTGSITGSPAGNAMAIVLAKGTAQAGRRRKGRIYVPGIWTAAVATDGTIDNTERSNIQTNQCANLLALIGPAGTSSTFEDVVWSDRIAMNVALSNTWPRVRTSQGAPSPTTADAAVTGYVCRDYIGSQRDRRPGL